MAKVRCSCGVVCENLGQWNQHYLIGLPNPVIASKLTGITVEQEERQWKEREAYQSAHRRRGEPC